jgi:hypothetical protein
MVLSEVCQRFRWPGTQLAPDSTPVPAVAGEFSIGRLRNAWQVVALGPFTANNIIVETVDRHSHYEPMVDALYEEFVTRVAAQTDGHRPTDNVCLSLRKFEATGRTPDVEEPILRMTFEQTTYFRGRVTNWNLDAWLHIDGVPTTQRAAWANRIDLRGRPVPQLGNVWGAILTVVTADGWVLLPLRGDTEVEPRCFGPSVGEEGLWARDVADDGSLDSLSLAQAGLKEELGVEIGPDDVVWLELGANTVCCRYALIGLVRVDLSRDQVGARMRGDAKDHWEIRQAFWTRFHPDSVAGFMTQPGRRFSPYGAASVLRALVYEFGWNACEAAFAEADVEIVRDPLVAQRLDGRPTT